MLTAAVIDNPNLSLLLKRVSDSGVELLDQCIPDCDVDMHLDLIVDFAYPAQPHSLAALLVATDSAPLDFDNQHRYVSA